MKASELRALTKSELELRLKELKAELFNLRFRKVTENMNLTHRFKEIKRDIARIKTLLRENELGIRTIAGGKNG